LHGLKRGLNRTIIGLKFGQPFPVPFFYQRFESNYYRIEIRPEKKGFRRHTGLNRTIIGLKFTRWEYIRSYNTGLNRTIIGLKLSSQMADRKELTGLNRTIIGLKYSTCE